MLDDPAFVARHRRGENDFTRRRKLPLATLVTFLLSAVKGSLQGELDRFFARLANTPLCTSAVTKAALSKARRKLLPSAFLELNAVLLEQAGVQRRWQGFRLCAVDGSVVNLPDTPEIRAHYQPRKPAAQACVQARASQLYDVLNHLTVEARLAPLAHDERGLAAEHLGACTAEDLVLYDRGYPAFWLFALHRQRQVPFCARVTVSLYRETEAFAQSGEPERTVYLTPSTAEARAQCRARGVSEAPLRVRLVRVELPGRQEPEILITSLLDTVAYPHELFAALYHQRWGVEEDYKRLKSRQRLEQFSGQSVLCIEQDFHAKVLNKNLTAVFAADAQARVDAAGAGRKHAYRVNFTAALATLKQALPTLLLGHSPPALGQQILAALAKTVEPLRPDRSVPRRRRRGPKYPPAYKPIP